MPNSFYFYFDAFDSSPTHTGRPAHLGRLIHYSIASFRSSPPDFFVCFDAIDVASRRRPDKTAAPSGDGISYGGDFAMTITVLKISNTGQEFSESLRTHVDGLAIENCRILQPTNEIPHLTKQQCGKARVAVPEDI